MLNNVVLLFLRVLIKADGGLFIGIRVICKYVVYFCEGYLILSRTLIFSFISFRPTTRERSWNTHVTQLSLSPLSLFSGLI